MVLGVYRYGLFPKGAHTMGREGGVAENALQGCLRYRGLCKGPL